MNRHVIIHTDGGARGNPGPAAIGVVIEDGGASRKYIHKEYIGHATNNQAEYRAAIAALEKAQQLGVDTVDLYLDSELVVRQLNGEYRVRDKKLRELFSRAYALLACFKRVHINHIPRKKNSEADKLVNRCLDEQIDT